MRIFRIFFGTAWSIIPPVTLAFIGLHLRIGFNFLSHSSLTDSSAYPSFTLYIVVIHHLAKDYVLLCLVSRYTSIYIYIFIFIYRIYIWQYPGVNSIQRERERSCISLIAQMNFLLCCCRFLHFYRFPDFAQILAPPPSVFGYHLCLFSIRGL